jgi:hypothetical protein
MRADWVKTTRERLGHIKVLSLDEMRLLPPVGPYDAGVYFLWLQDELQYVGKSKQVSERIAQQGRALRHNALTLGRRGIPHDRYTALRVEDGRRLEWDLRDLEQIYIATYEPPFNTADMFACTS